MNKATKVILIANDVIQQLKSGILFAVDGNILGWGARTHIRNILEHDNGTKNVKDILCKMEATHITCDVCAKGSLFISYIKRFNSITSTEFVQCAIGADDNALLRTNIKINTAFVPSLLDQIEVLYERSTMFPWVKLPKARQHNLVEFSRTNLANDLNTRLIQIMELLIENDGRGIDIKKFSKISTQS